MSLKLDEIKVDGSTMPGVVVVSFGNIDLQLPPDVAEKLSYALMTQADRAREKVPA